MSRHPSPNAVAGPNSLDSRPPMAAPDPRVTGLILAGGRATRMSGRDKGLLMLAGRPMVEHVLTALRSQVAQVLINANRNRQRYEEFGVPVVSDPVGGYLGPLAGVASGLEAAETELVLTLPCDSPLVPRDLASRMVATLDSAGAEIVAAHDGKRLQPVFALLRTTLLDDLRAYLDSGGRKIDIWFPQRRFEQVDFSDNSDAFVNVNTPEDRAALEQRMRTL